MLDHTAIDEIDERIMKVLLKDSRTSFTKIAKECKISVNAIRKRYSLLWKAGIINGEIMLVDPQKLGYKCIVTAEIMTKIEDERKVMEFLKSKPYIRKIFKNSLEKLNIGCIISLQGIQYLSEIIQDIEANPLVKYVNTILWKKTTNNDYPENLILRNTISKSGGRDLQKPNSPNLKKIELDETDRQIAKILSQKSRTPFTKIAKELNISINKIIQRYNKLEGTLLINSTITINLKRLGYNAMVDLRLKLTNRSQTQEILAEILKIPNVIVVLEYVGGDLDLFPIIAIKDFSELFRLKQQLSTIKGIEQASMFLNEPYHMWPLNMFASLL